MAKLSPFISHLWPPGRHLFFIHGRLSRHSCHLICYHIPPLISKRRKGLTQETREFLNWPCACLRSIAKTDGSRPCPTGPAAGRAGVGVITGRKVKASHTVNSHRECSRAVEIQLLARVKGLFPREQRVCVEPRRMQSWKGE